jgi:hypothetical protein
LNGFAASDWEPATTIELVDRKGFKGDGFQLAIMPNYRGELGRQRI